MDFSKRQAGAFKPNYVPSGKGFSQRPVAGFNNQFRLIFLKTFEMISNNPVIASSGPDAVIDLLVKSNVVKKDDENALKAIRYAFKKYNYGTRQKQFVDPTDSAFRLLRQENTLKITKKALRKIIHEELFRIQEENTLLEVEKPKTGKEPDQDIDVEPEKLKMPGLTGLAAKAADPDVGKAEFFRLDQKVDQRDKPQEQASLIALYAAQHADEKVPGTATVALLRKAMMAASKAKAT